MKTLDVDRVIALVSAAGIELIDRRRNKADDGWSLSFSNGAVVNARDNGQIAISGKGKKAVASVLGMSRKPGGSRRSREA